MKEFMVFLAGFIALFVIVDLMQKNLFKSIKWSRKATHILSGFLIVMMPDYLSREQIILLAIIFTIILAASKWKKILSLHDVERKTLGEVFYPFSILLLSLICLPGHINVFQTGVLVLALSDGLTGIIGELWNFGTYKVFRNTKSIGGAITFFMVTFGIFIGFHGVREVSISKMLIGSAFLAVSEFFLTYGSDNLILPILTALIELHFFI